MKPLPTDLSILSEIYERYYDEFASYSQDDRARESKIYVPIDIEGIASNLGVDPDIVFGRLYYDLDKKHGYRKNDGTLVHLFSLAVGQNRHCVNFPLMASVLAELKQESRKFRTATAITAISIVIAILSLVVSAIVAALSLLVSVIALLI